MYICSHDIGSNLFSKRQFSILLQAPQIMIDWWNENVFTYLPKISFTWHGYSHCHCASNDTSLLEKWNQPIRIWKQSSKKKLFDAEQFYLQQRNSLMQSNFICSRAIVFAADALYLMQHSFIWCRETLFAAGNFIYLSGLLGHGIFMYVIMEGNQSS